MKKIFWIFFCTLFLANCSQEKEEIPTSYTGEIARRVIIREPLEGESIQSPLTVRGQAPGNWFFEATAPILIVDWDGKILAEHFIQAEGEWMTTDLVDFEGEIEFEVPEDIPSWRGTLILQRHNASDLPQNDAAVEVPIMFHEK